MPLFLFQTALRLLPAIWDSELQGHVLGLPHPIILASECWEAQVWLVISHS